MERPELHNKVSRLPHSPGIYLMKDRLGSVLYIGKAKDLKRRVSSYFQASRPVGLHQPKLRTLMPLVHDIEVYLVRNEAEALLLEGQLIKKWKPRYNTDFTDDKRFLLVRVDLQSSIPKFRLTRVKNDPHSRYFGPFVHGHFLRKTLHEIRLKFGIVLGDATPKCVGDGLYHLYEDARAEIYGHPNEVSTQDYQLRVARACAFLEGKSFQVLEELQQHMQKAAEERAYEKAAYLRDQIFALRKTLEPQRRNLPDPLSRAATPNQLELLQNRLGLARPPQHIECFDISHISGSFVVASMVHFTEGKPDKAAYRRYRIQTFVGNDDYRAMEEVVGRRYGRFHVEGRPLPDLVVIDGGVGQIQAALKAFTQLELSPPPLIGLAKREETIHFSDGRDPLTLPAQDRALHLLQRIRDEAHRFANDYNAHLRSRRIRESILDDFPGLGPTRKARLLEEFGSIHTLRQASVEALAAVKGVSLPLATRLHAFLNGKNSLAGEGAEPASAT